MKNNYLILVDNLNFVKDYERAGISAFLFALQDFSVGYENTFSIEELPQVNGKKYVLINRVLNCQDVETLEELFHKNIDIDGIVYEDIAVYQLVRKLNLQYELIFYQNHFQCNSVAVSFWLSNGIDGVFVSNELTLEEVRKIDASSPGKCIIHLFGYNQIMYSRRLLVSNYHKNFRLPLKTKGELVEPLSNTHFKILESKYGTVLYSNKIFNGKALLKVCSPKYFFINTVFVSHDDVMKFLTDFDSNINNCDDGFLNRETIYKLKKEEQ